jgi:exodeoxyribonuclease VII small subunit
MTKDKVFRAIPEPKQWAVSYVDVALADCLSTEIWSGSEWVDILKRLDNSETPIDKLAEDVKLGAKLIKDLGKKLNQVETEIRDAFKELEGGDEDG